MDQSKLRISIRRPVTVIMLFLGMIVFGIKSYQELSLNLLPDISYPTLTIRTEYPEAAPEEVENFISRPVEEALSTVDNLVEISSISSAGISEVILEFTWDTDMDFALLDVQKRTGSYGTDDEIASLDVTQEDPQALPVARIAVTSDEYADLDERRAGTAAMGAWPRSGCWLQDRCLDPGRVPAVLLEDRVARRQEQRGQGRQLHELSVVGVLESPERVAGGY